jgi:hypothetical protein
MISPKNVMTTVENINADNPAITEFESSVSNTLIPTFPQRIVDKRKFESSLSFNTFMAALFLFAASISKRSLGTLKKARFNPENMADWVMQKPIPNQSKRFVSDVTSICRAYKQAISSLSKFLL